MPQSSDSSQTVGVAVLGCGYWGPNHVRVFRSFDQCRVTAIDVDPLRLQRIARDFAGVEVRTDFCETLRNPDIDAVVIATPTASHFKFVELALEHGKHVLCEKPLCTDDKQAARLVDLSSRCDRVLMVGNVFLFNPGIEVVKRLVDQGELGRLRYLSAVRTNLGPIRSDVNASFDLASHDISIFNWIVGSEPCTVSATGGAYVQEGIHDVTFLNLTYPGGEVGSIHASWLNPKKVRQMTLVGSQRMATWDDLDRSNPVAVYDRGAEAHQEYNDFGEFLRISTWDNEVRMPRVEATEPLEAQCRCFLDSLMTGKVAGSNGSFSRGVVRVLEAANRSLCENGSPVKLITAT